MLKYFWYRLISVGILNTAQQLRFNRATLTLNFDLDISKVKEFLTVVVLKSERMDQIFHEYRTCTFEELTTSATTELTNQTPNKLA